jgi:hypothetical protein
LPIWKEEPKQSTNGVEWSARKQMISFHRNPDGMNPERPGFLFANNAKSDSIIP